MKDERMTITLKSPTNGTYSPPQSAPPIQRRSKRMRRRFIAAAIPLAVIALVFFACFLAYSKIKQSAGSPTTNNAGDVVAQVGKLMLLPEETPTIAVVSDLSKLKGQKFFANAKEGDIVLMYAEAGEAVLYSPSLNKIIQVAPITNGPQ